MRIFKIIATTFSVLFLFVSCLNRENQANVKRITEISVADSTSKSILQTFALPFSAPLNFDSNSLLFYCSRAYDTSSLIEINKNNNLIRGIYYEVLPEYHRFLTDYKDTSSKIIYFISHSFSIDSVTWYFLTDQANLVLHQKSNLSKNEKYTDGSTYGLYYNSQSRVGNTNDEAAFKKFDSLLKVEFLWKHAQLKKPFMYKKK